MRYVSSGTTRRGWATAAGRASSVPRGGEGISRRFDRAEGGTAGATGGMGQLGRRAGATRARRRTGGRSPVSLAIAVRLAVTRLSSSREVARSSFAHRLRSNLVAVRHAGSSREATRRGPSHLASFGEVTRLRFVDGSSTDGSSTAVDEVTRLRFAGYGSVRRLRFADGYGSPTQPTVQRRGAANDRAKKYPTPPPRTTLRP
jgi:hypothetical protein